MDSFKDVLRKVRPQKLKAVFRDNNNPTLKKYIVGIGVFAIVCIVTSIIVTFLLVRWLWNAAVNTANTNPTISSVVENTKAKVGNLLPNVPSSPQDFIANGIVDTEKIQQTYADIPAQTQVVWKSAIESGINQQIQGATGTSLQQLQDLQKAIQQLSQ